MKKPHWGYPKEEYCEKEYDDSTCHQACLSKAAVDLRDHLRLLWEQHVYWTRMTIISMAYDLPDLEPTTNRLLRNASDFEAAFKPLYGSRAAREFGELLTAHLTIAGELVQASKEGNSRAAANAEKRWYANGDEIVSFLADINPYLSEEHWRKMWYEHLALTKSEAVAILTQNYTKSIAILDKIEMQALMMADNLACGIMKQFPEKFVKRTE